jgi:predicted kinase
MSLTLYLIRGLPGCGKSTLGHDMVRARMAQHCYEADQYFNKYNFALGKWEYNFDATKLGYSHLACQENTKEALKYGQSVVVSNTSTTEREVKIYEDIAKEFNARFVCIVVERRHDGVSVHDVPAEKMQQFSDRFSIKI